MHTGLCFMTMMARSSTWLRSASMKLVLLWLTLHSLGPAAPSALRMIFGLLPTAK